MAKGAQDGLRRACGWAAAHLSTLFGSLCKPHCQLISSTAELNPSGSWMHANTAVHQAARATTTCHQLQAVKSGGPHQPAAAAPAHRTFCTSCARSRVYASSDRLIVFTFIAAAVFAVRLQRSQEQGQR